MIVTETKIRVYYQDTDQMGVVYYGNYARYYEIGRTEMIRDMGFTYRQMEEMDIMLPARSLKINYLKSAYYDDLLTIRTRITRITPAKLEHEYQVLRGTSLLAEARSLLACVDRDGRVQRIPEEFGT